MEKEELYRYVDHTALKAFTTWKDIEKLCEEAIKYRISLYPKLLHQPGKRNLRR